MKKNISVFLIPVILFFVPCAAHADGGMDLCLDEYLDSMPPEEAVAQIFLVNIQGNASYAALETSADGKPLVPGGALFFSYNLADTAEESIAFISSIEKYCDDACLLRPYLAIDQEGGLVNRMRSLSSTLPSAQRVSGTLSPSRAAELYSIQARQMRALGFDMNLAPVAEAVNPDNAQFLDTRSFGGIPESAAYSVAAVRAYEENGIRCVLKHFPGNTGTDPHTGLPEIGHDINRVEAEFMLPFFFALSSGPSAVLMSHARVPSVDSAPACLSRVWVTQKLKGELGFDGLVISDDIFMAALSDNGYPPETAAVQAIDAGVHVIMLSEKLFADVARGLLIHAEEDAAFARRLRDAEKKVIAFKIKTGILKIEDTGNGKKIVPVSMREQLGSPEERLEKFTEAKKEGDEFYERYFVRGN